MARNRVGYMNGELQEDGISAGSCFVPVSGELIDLIDLKVTGYDTEDPDIDSEVQIQTLDEYGHTDREFVWKDLTFKKVKYYGWYDRDSEDPLEEDEITIQPGEGLWLNCDEEGFTLQSSGQVPTEDVAVELQEDGLTVANPTPVDVDLYNVKITGYDTEDPDTDSEVQIQTLDEYGHTDREFVWKDLTFKKVKYYGWYDRDSEDPLEEDDIVVKPGQGLWTNCDFDGFSLVWPKVVIAK